MHWSTGQGLESADFPHDRPRPVTGWSVSRLSDPEPVHFVDSAQKKMHRAQHPQNQGQAKGKSLVLVSLSSKGKPKELPVPPDDLNVKIGHRSGRQ